MKRIGFAEEFVMYIYAGKKELKYITQALNNRGYYYSHTDQAINGDYKISVTVKPGTATEVYEIFVKGLGYEDVKSTL